MAKKEISSVEMKNPEPIVLRNGMVITPENLTIDRYEKLVSLNSEFKKLFNVKLTPKKDEMESKK